MRRRIAVITAFLILGAVVNVAVAWFGFAATDGNGYQRMLLYEQWSSTTACADELWIRHASDGWPQTPSQFQSWHGVFASGRTIAVSIGGSFVISLDDTESERREIYRGSGSFLVEQVNCGLPLRAMRIERWRGLPASSLFPVTTGNDGVRFGNQTFPRRSIVVGFIINTLFYAAVLWLLFAGPFAARRMIRRRRGLCEKCAYPIGVSPVCTECGAAIVYEAGCA